MENFILKKDLMSQSIFDVIIIGGSYAGLSAAMALGRSLRNVLVIDDGQPCNRQTPHSHNFITQDGKTPSEISAIAKAEVEQYATVEFYQGLAVEGQKVADGFEIKTSTGGCFKAKKLILATGIKDIMPNIEGFEACWGISVLHCPYCHGYEVRNKKTGIIANGAAAFHYAQLISNWTKDLTLFTNGVSLLTDEETEKLATHNIKIIETKLQRLRHKDGYIEIIELENGQLILVDAIYGMVDFVQNSTLANQLRCGLNDAGLIQVDGAQETTVEGIFACGDNSSKRALAFAVASGTLAGVMANFKLIEATL
jgi:thioredoxin reductase